MKKTPNAAIAPGYESIFHNTAACAAAFAFCIFLTGWGIRFPCYIAMICLKHKTTDRPRYHFCAHWPKLGELRRMSTATSNASPTTARSSLP